MCGWVGGNITAVSRQREHENYVKSDIGGIEECNVAATEMWNLCVVVHILTY